VKGTDEYIEVTDSINIITGELGVDPVLSLSGGSRGLTGDKSFIFLDCFTFRNLGWRPKLATREAVIRTIRYLKVNSWVFEARKVSAWS
jgi:UDP-glucose 4-epimerase